MSSMAPRHRAGSADRRARPRRRVFNADVVIFTGQRTGHAADLDYLRKIRAAASLPTLVGSGVDPDNVRDILAIVDGVIVASALKVDGRWWNPVDRERAKLFVQRARKAP